jgi:tape measure domain-containing protein
MANKINSEDLFDKGLFDVLIKGIGDAETELAKLEKSLGNIGAKFKQDLQALDVKNLDSINEILKKNKEIEKSLHSQFELEKEKLKLQAQKERLEIQLADFKKKTQEQEEVRLKRLAEKEQKRLSKEQKDADNLANAYKRLEKNTRELKNESKRLGAEMLELEKSGKRNTKAYYDLEKQYEKVTKSAQEGDKALKKLDSQVGDNFRNVGNYGKALGGLTELLQRMGMAFGIYEIAQFGKGLLTTQVQLDRLRLSLQNVSGSTKEYQANFAFLRDISLSYGQDLLSLVDTYKNFMASTEESNLLLGERRRIYESIIKAGSALALSNDDVEGTLRAVQQMFSKGTIQAEELRQQLGDRLPGAFSLMAKAVGVSEAKLGEMMKNGQIMTDEVMPKFAILLEEQFGKKASKNLETLNGAWNAFKTNLTLYIDQAQASVNINKSLAWTIKRVGENIGGILKATRQVVTAFLLYKATLIAVDVRQRVLSSGFYNLIKSFFKGELSIKSLATSFKALTASTEGFSSALKSISLFAVIQGITTLTEKFIDLANGTDLARERYLLYQGAVSKGNKKANDFLRGINDDFFTYQKKQQEDRKKGLISEEQLKKNIANAELSREEKIRKRIGELQRSIQVAKSKRVEIRADYKGMSPDEIVKKQLEAGDDYEKLWAISEHSIDFNKRVAKTYDMLGANATDFSEQLIDLNKELNKYNVLGQGTAKANNDASYSYKPLIKDLKTVEIEYKTINNYLQDHINLLNEIELYNSERGATVRATQFEDEFKRQMEEVQVNGQYNLQILGKLKQEEQDFLIDAEKKQTEIVIKQRKDEFEKRTKSLEESLEKEKQDYLSNFVQQQTKLATAEENLSRATYNLKNEKVGSKKYAKDSEKIKQLKAEADAQRKIYDNLTKETLTKFEERSTELQQAKESEDKEIGAWELFKAKELEDKVSDIKKKAFDEWTQEEKDLIYAHDEWRLNNIKKLANSTNELIQMGMDTYVKSLERNISLVEDKMNRLNQRIDFLQQKAATGNITANESLAQAQEDQLNAEKEKAKFQRTIQRMQFAMTIFNAYNSNIQNAKVGENPFTKTITDISALTAFVGSLPTFYEGTDTTIADALGNPHLQGKDGYVVRVDGSEKVLNPYLSSKTGNLTTRDIAQIAEDRLKGKLTYSHEGASSTLSAWQLVGISDKLDELTNVIKNKPETNIAMGEIVGGVMKIVETTKVSNTTTRNIHRFNKKI